MPNRYAFGFLMAAACLSFFCLFSHDADAAQYPPYYQALMDEAAEMGTLSAIMPVRIFNLASRFAEGPDQALAARLADTELTRSPSKFVRRVGYTAIRFMGKKDFPETDMPVLILRGLDDENDWVRYDAVWAGEAVGLDTPAFREKLAGLAQGLDPAEYDAIPASDAAKQLQRRAGKLLRKLSEQ